MKQAIVFHNKERAGTLTETNERNYIFRYDDTYFKDSSKRMISLTLPKNQQEYRSPHLFPFFFNLIAEGSNLSLQSRHLKIDKRDHFSLLCATAQYDTIGPVTIKPIKP